MMVLPSTTVRLVPEGQRAGNAPGRRGEGEVQKPSLSPLSSHCPLYRPVHEGRR